MAYTEPGRSMRGVSVYLQRSLGLRTSDRSAGVLPNWLQYSVTFSGGLRAAPGAVKIAPRYTVGGLRHQLRGPGAVAIAALKRNPTLNLAVVAIDVGECSWWSRSFSPMSWVTT